MSRRKTYGERLDALREKAKAETASMMKARGVSEVDLTGYRLLIFGGRRSLRPWPVTKVTLSRGAGGDVLRWESPCPSTWVETATLWLAVADAVRDRLERRERMGRKPYNTHSRTL